LKLALGVGSSTLPTTNGLPTCANVLALIDS
jgi:hypothetical protein